MQPFSYSSRLILGLSLSLALSIPVMGQSAGSAPQTQTPTRPDSLEQPPTVQPGSVAPASADKEVAEEVPAAVKLSNDIEPTESLRNPMVTPGYSFDQVRKAPIFGTPRFFEQSFGPSPYRVEIQAPRGYADFIQDQKLRLSLRSYLDLVLANNTGIAIQKLQLEGPKNAVLRATSFLDPTATLAFTATRSQSPAGRTLEGANVVSSLNQPANVSYQQTFLPGTQLNTSMNITRSSSNDQFRLFNPQLGSSFAINLSQPLLRNRGTYINKIPILIARNTLKTSEFQFESQVVNILTQAESAYWDYVEARENLRVQEAALELRDASLKRAQRELELGAIPELDIFQPQADFAQAQVNLTQARFRLARTEDALRQQMGIDLDPNLRTLPIEITDTVPAPAAAGAIDKEQYVQIALQNRPDMLQQRQQLVGADLSIQQSANLLKPNLSLTAQYASQERGGMQLINGVVDNIGLWSVLGNTFAFNFPTYSFGLQLQLPLRNRNAVAGYSDALAQKKLTMLQVRSLEESVRLDVLNALNNLDSSRESVRLASIARDFAQKRLDAEQRKYDLGTSTVFFLQSAQTDLITADQRVVTERINYNRNRLQMLRLTGTLLSERGVVIR
ncbi:MAG: TolC family protein [Bryobacterales bacterium]|nr:TolC family protein [Bryobacterales bacterium]